MILLSNSISPHSSFFLWEEFRSFLLQFNALTSFSWMAHIFPRATGSMSVSLLWMTWSQSSYWEGKRRNVWMTGVSGKWHAEHSILVCGPHKKGTGKGLGTLVKPQGSTVVLREAQGHAEISAVQQCLEHAGLSFARQLATLQISS